MKTLKSLPFAFLLFTLLLSGSLSAKSATASAAFSTFTTLDGTWKNSNPNALPKLVISGNTTRIRAWGKCTPTNCDWGTVRLSKYGSGHRAIFRSSVATRYLILTTTADGRLKVNATYVYRDRRPTKRFVYYFKQNGGNKIDGIWANLNPNALPQLYVYANSTKLKAWGKCHPTNCEWGSTRLTKIGNSYRAVFNDHVAYRTLILTPLANNRLRVSATYNYKDRRPTKRFSYSFKLAAQFAAAGL